MPATRSTQRFCPECGAKVTKTQKFCRECGADLQAEVAGADETQELQAPAAKPATSRAKSAASSRAAAATTPIPPPPPPPAMPPPSPSARPAAAGVATAEPPWPAWLAAGACGVLVIAVGLSWSGGGFDVSGLDVPLAGLFTNNVSNGFPIGVLFLLAAAAGLGVALFRPETRIMSTTFLVTGGASLFFLLWLMIRIMSQLQGASLFDVLSIGFWLAFLASIGVLVGGIMLRVTGRTAAA